MAATCKARSVAWHPRNAPPRPRSLLAPSASLRSSRRSDTGLFQCQTSLWHLQEPAKRLKHQQFVSIYSHRAIVISSYSSLYLIAVGFTKDPRAILDCTCFRRSATVTLDASSCACLGGIAAHRDQDGASASPPSSRAATWVIS